MIWLITFTWAGIFEVTISDSYLLQYSGKTVGRLANLLPIVVTCPNHGSSPYTSKILLRISGDMPSRDWWTSILWKINISTSGPLIAVTRKVHAMAMIICDTFLTHLLGNKLRPSYQFANAMVWYPYHIASCSDAVLAVFLAVERARVNSSLISDIVNLRWEKCSLLENSAINPKLKVWRFSSCWLIGVLRQTYSAPHKKQV